MYFSEISLHLKRRDLWDASVDRLICLQNDPPPKERRDLWNASVDRLISDTLPLSKNVGTFGTHRLADIRMSLYRDVRCSLPYPALYPIPYLQTVGVLTGLEFGSSPTLSKQSESGG